MEHDHTDQEHAETELDAEIAEQLDAYLAENGLIIVPADTHDHDGESLWESTVEVVTDPPHIASEVVMESASYLIFGLMVTPLIRWWVKRHDREHHGHDCDTDHADATF